MFLQCLYAFMASVGFCIIFNIRGRNIFWGSLGGGLGWAVYLICKTPESEVVGYFLAALTVTLYSEIMAVIRRKPSTTFLIPSIIPMVPGGAIYSAMAAWLHGAESGALDKGNYALSVACALAIGIILGTVLARMERAGRKRWLKWVMDRKIEL